VLKFAEVIAVSHFLYKIDQIAMKGYLGKNFPTAQQLAESYKKTGRVPHVRLSVRGPKKIAKPTKAFTIFEQQIQRGTGKAVETYRFLPRYALSRGTRPVLMRLCWDTDSAGVGAEP
jgi:hypothetical protein